MSFSIGKSKTEKRVLHWQDIKSRVTTHEGEVLSGNKGQQYQQKWGKKYLGVESKPTDFSQAQYQKELSKTK